MFNLNSRTKRESRPLQRLTSHVGEVGIRLHAPNQRPACSKCFPPREPFADAAVTMVAFVPGAHDARRIWPDGQPALPQGTSDITHPIVRMVCASLEQADVANNVTRRNEA